MNSLKKNKNIGNIIDERITRIIFVAFQQLYNRIFVFFFFRFMDIKNLNSIIIDDEISF